MDNAKWDFFETQYDSVKLQTAKYLRQITSEAISKRNL